jgi:nucleoside-diphosphate-sugar epimerase
MKVLVTGSSGRLGEALVRTLKNQNYEVLGLDLLDSEFTITRFFRAGRHGTPVHLNTRRFILLSITEQVRAPGEAHP